MKKSMKTSDARILKIQRRLLMGASLTLSMAMIFSITGCQKNKADDSGTASSEAAYFSSKMLDFSKAADGERANIECVKQLRDKTGILISGTSKYYIQRYDNAGHLISQTALEDAIDPESITVDIAGDADGNLHVLTHSQDKITRKIISKVFTFDIEGALVGKPFVITVGDTVSQKQIEIDNDGNIYLYFSSDLSGHRGISVLDSSGSPLYDISDTNGIIVRNLFLIDDQMYTAGYDSTGEKLKIGLYPLDNAGKRLGEPIDISNTLGSDAASLSFGTDGLYSYDSAGVYSVRLDNKKASPLCLWKDTDLKKSVSDNDLVIVLSPDTIMVFKQMQLGDLSSASVSLLTRKA